MWAKCVCTQPPLPSWIAGSGAAIAHEELWSEARELRPLHVAPYEQVKLDEALRKEKGCPLPPQETLQDQKVHMWLVASILESTGLESRRGTGRLPRLRKQQPMVDQDGGVEGRALTPSCKNIRITTSCWTIIDRKTLELTKKDTPHAKTKEKPQWDGRRGAITVKSNHITAGWVTHRLEKTYTTEVHPLEWTFWTPHQAFEPGGPATGGGIPRESDFEG